MASAELIAIGTELLLGEIQDTNTRYLTRQLRELGINVFRTTIIGDNSLRIAEAMRECLDRCDILITTGGLGPTVDDPTRVAAALAINEQVEFHPELWKQISERFYKRGIVPTENNRKQAFLPASAHAIHNPVGTAPAFYLDKKPGILICLPGVPSEMETIFHVSVVPLLSQLFNLHEIIKTRVLHTCCMGESSIDALIADLEEMQNPTVGLSAHAGNVDVRITVKADSESSANELLEKIELEITRRLPDVIYGSDEATLPGVINQLARSHQKKVLILMDQYRKYPLPESEFDHIDFLEIQPQNLRDWLDQNRHKIEINPILGVHLYQSDENFNLDLQFQFKDIAQHVTRRYNGPPSQVGEWALNTSLGYLWQKLVALN